MVFPVVSALLPLAGSAVTAGAAGEPQTCAEELLGTVKLSAGAGGRGGSQVRIRPFVNG